MADESCNRTNHTRGMATCTMETWKLAQGDSVSVVKKDRSVRMGSEQQVLVDAGPPADPASCRCLNVLERADSPDTPDVCPKSRRVDAGGSGQEGHCHTAGGTGDAKPTCISVAGFGLVDLRPSRGSRTCPCGGRRGVIVLYER